MTNYTDFHCFSSFICDSQGIRVAAVVETEACTIDTFPNMGSFATVSYSTYPKNVTIMVDWREDLSAEYFNFTSVTVDYSSGFTDINGATEVSLSTRLKRKQKGTFFSYDDSSHRLDLFHVYRTPDKYKPFLQGHGSGAGQFSCFCQSDKVKRNNMESLHTCQSGEAIQDSNCFGKYYYIGRDGSCSSTPIDESMRLSTFLWVMAAGMFALVGIAVYRLRVQSKRNDVPEPQSIP